MSLLVVRRVLAAKAQRLPEAQATVLPRIRRSEGLAVAVAELPLMAGTAVPVVLAAYTAAGVVAAAVPKGVLRVLAAQEPTALSSWSPSNSR
jgi:hypothetical protein